MNFAAFFKEIFKKRGAPSQVNEKEGCDFNPETLDLSDLQILTKVARISQRLVWGTYDQRKFFEQNGVHLNPANFYSGTPTLQDIEESFEKESETPFLDSIHFDQQFLNDELKSLIPHTKDFDFPLEDDEENPQGFFIKNSQFSHSDCFAYYAMIRKYRPRNIVEIGSGFSSLLAKEALNRNHYGKLVCYEPYPRTFLAKIADELIQKKIQTCSTDEIVNKLSDGDILFIDSTHTVKAGSDCLWIYLKLFPALMKAKKKIFVHIHDIFLPNPMPPSFAIENRLNWNEQYLLLAFLIGNNSAKIMFPVEYHRIFNKDLLKSLKNGYESEKEGGSFWFSIGGDPHE